MDDIDKLYQEVVSLWGINSQLNIAQEECAELITAISHFRRDNTTTYKMSEEIADVRIMLDQLESIFGIKDEVRSIQAEKLYRLRKRVDKKGKDRC